MQFVPRNFIITKVWQIARQASQTCMYRSNAQLPKKKKKKEKAMQDGTYVCQTRDILPFIVFQYSPSLICASETA